LLKSKLVLFLGAIFVSVFVRVPTATAQSYGLEWPGDGAVRRMLYWHNAFPISSSLERVPADFGSVPRWTSVKGFPGIVSSAAEPEPVIELRAFNRHNA